MSSLTESEKRYLEAILGMGGGYVLNYADATFGALFNRHKINIHGIKYQTYGTSKARKLRSFWEQEPDLLVAAVLAELLDAYEADCDINNKKKDTSLLEKSKQIVQRLKGESKVQSAHAADNFLDHEFNIPNLHKLPIEPSVAEIIGSRLNEARTALSAGAHLSVIFLCGSVLEAVLLGAAQRSPEKFNRATASPKSGDGKVRPLPDWTLSQFIDVACEIDLLKPDVKKFSHGLKDFRNYIHPYQQMVSGFTPDQHTAKVCFQVLKAALANLAGDR
ncbi:hypothetical protein [Acidocella aromatica]|uniref:Uncharacterized protein n=1 Tax=Acidocella aromatica TaxID=1303579 RepID=A0A840VT47_9PROT|nr:hypothetical protein [Acidocella aromatica]MBB5374490.1 hypothetical protein [Acidocella aromatica]